MSALPIIGPRDAVVLVEREADDRRIRARVKIQVPGLKGFHGFVQEALRVLVDRRHMRLRDREFLDVGELRLSRLNAGGEREGTGDQ